MYDPTNDQPVRHWLRPAQRKTFEVSFTCSGFFVGPDGHIVTAGHCAQYDTAHAPVPMTSAQAKACPDCAGTIKAAARVCHFCGHRFDAVEQRTRV